MAEPTGHNAEVVRLVRDGYDKVSWAYQDDVGSIDPGIRIDAIADLGARLAPGSRVLDLGCGSGVPVARELSLLGFDVTGVDVSPVQIQRARALVPRADFVCQDVVRTSDWQRDHRSRDSIPGQLLVVVEGIFRELTGPGRLLGNRVVLELDDGTYAVYGHVRRRSLRVRRGDRVHRGQVIGEVGNSGNSTEPHLHFQIQDHVSVLVAAGLPVAFDGVSVDGRTVDVPARMEIATFASA